MSDPQYRSDPAAGGSGSNGPAIAAVVTGVVALLLSWIPGINLLAFLLAIAALVTGVMGMRRAARPDVGGKGMAIAGIVTGGLALILGVLVYVGLASMFNDPEVQQQLEEIQQEVEQQQQELEQEVEQQGADQG